MRIPSPAGLKKFTPVLSYITNWAKGSTPIEERERSRLNSRVTVDVTRKVFFRSLDLKGYILSRLYDFCDSTNMFLIGVSGEQATSHLSTWGRVRVSIWHSSSLIQHGTIFQHTYFLSQVLWTRMGNDYPVLRTRGHESPLD